MTFFGFSRQNAKTQTQKTQNAVLNTLSLWVVSRATAGEEKLRLSQQRTLTEEGLGFNVDMLFGSMSCVSVCVGEGRFARLASLGSLSARVHCGYHDIVHIHVRDFLNPFRKSRAVCGV